MTTAHQYALDVTSGKILAGEYIIKAGQRFLDDLTRKDVYFDEADAERYTGFIEECLHLWEGEWRGEKMQLFPYQQFIIQNIFGWKFTQTPEQIERGEIPRRRFRDAYIQTAKKQGKTTLMSAIAYAHLIIDRSDPTPQIIVGANNEEQAKICVNSCGKMVDVSPLLLEMEQENILSRRRYSNSFHQVNYQDDVRDGVIKAISRDVKTKAGKNPSCFIIDEYMAADSDELYKELRNAQNLRRQPLGIVITTPGFDKSVPCYTKLRKNAVDVLNKTVELDNLFAAVFEFPEEEWENEDYWIMSNPIIEYVPQVKESLRVDYKVAKAEGGHSIVDFKTKELGMWCDAASVWIPSETINAANYGFTEADLVGAECYVGIDLSTTTDLTAFAEFYPNLKDGKHALYVHSYVTQKKIDNRSTDIVDYKKWADQGWVTVHSGNALEGDIISEDMLARWEERQVQGIGYDERMFNAMVAAHIKHTDYLSMCDPVKQTFSGLSNAIQTLEAWLLNGEIDLMGNPVLVWAFSCVELEVGSQGDYRPHKGKSKGRIDPVAASLTAIAKYLKENAKQEEQGLMYFGSI